jgi:alpha-galactosidase
VAEVTYDEATATWLLRMSSCCYGIVLSGEARLPYHLHWGPLLDHEGLSAISAGAEVASNVERIAWGKEDPHEYVPWGGRRYDEPSLKVEYPDGTRGIEWRLATQLVVREDEATTLVLGLADSAYPLRVDLCYRVFDDCDVLERWAKLVHTGESGTIVIRQAHSANWWMPRREVWNLSYLHGGWGSETQIAETTLGPAKVVLESRRGTTSHELQPWFALSAGDAIDEEHGEVWSAALAWSGSWKLVLETTTGGHLHASGGWNDFDSPIDLLPGKEVVLPVFAGLYSSEGLGGASRAWHYYELAHVLSRPGRPGGSPSFPPLVTGTRVPAPVVPLPPLRPVLYNSWEATTFSVSEEGQVRLAELAADMGVELFVVDDGWFVGRNDDRAGLGDWTVDPKKFPRGLDPLIERVKALDMGFGLWVEPEMVNPNSDLYRAHPDWVFHFANRGRSEKRNQLVLNLARDDVADWVYKTLDHLLSEHQIDFLKWDMNRHFSEPGWPAEVGNNPERSWVDHTRHLYHVLERLRSAHPGVDIESCSGGGGRADLGILSRTQQVWTSDNTDAWDRLCIQEGFSYAYAPLAMMAWVTDSPNPLTGRALPLRYRFHVAMAGSLGIGGDLTKWSRAELTEAKELVAKYKEIRPVVQHGRLYRLASTRRGPPLGAMQYVSRDGSELVVLAWLGPRRYGPWPTRLRLRGLETTSRYTDVETGEEHGGAVLVELGLRLPEGLDFTSMLVHFVRVEGR